MKKVIIGEHFTVYANNVSPRFRVRAKLSKNITEYNADELSKTALEEIKKHPEKAKNHLKKLKKI